MCGVTSRRKADLLIEQGRVTVNGKQVTGLGYMIDPAKDDVHVDNIRVEAERKRYIKFNKPRFTVTSLANSEGNKETITKLLSGINERVYPVGRLDYDVEGLLLLTNDGKLAQKIHHPKNNVSKVYIATVRGKPSKKHIGSMERGASLEEGIVKPDSVELIGESTVRISFHEGKKHLVKRFLSGFGFPVVHLKRTAIGGINLGRLETGQWKDLTTQELKTIKSAANLES